MDYQVVLAIAEEAHFGRAARKLGVTQPALSSRLRRIEEELGVRLFNRDRAGVTATPAGEQFIEGAERVITVAEETTQSARNAQAGLGQTLKVGMTQVAAYQIVVPALSIFRKDHPHARIRLKEGTTAALERSLEQGAIDVAFLHPPLHAPEIADTHLVSTKMAVFNPSLDLCENRPAVSFPRSEAPVLMGVLSRQSSEGDGKYPSAEANTMLGAVVLARAGFGPCTVPSDYRPHIAEMERNEIVSDTGLSLDTSVARRALDRRQLVLSLIGAAVMAANNTESSKL